MLTETRTDGRLLADFSGGSGEAFEELVRRYNGLVTGVCRRIAPQDAEEVAQAVFLTLAHKAASLQGTACVAGWLHHVARDLARNAQKAAVRRKRREEEAGRMKREEAGWEELRPVLDQELDALPEKYRVPLLLHYFQDRTQEDIARELGCQVGTISTWLHRGREMLRGRLARSGVVVSAALLGTLIAENAVSAAAVTGGIVSSAAAVSPQVLAIMNGGLKAMAIAKFKVVAAAVVLSAGMAGSGVVAYQALHDKGCKADLTPQTFPSLHALVRPQPNEWRHLRVEWITDVIAARRKAASEDKPMIVLYTGGAGYNEPLGVC